MDELVELIGVGKIDWGVELFKMVELVILVKLVELIGLVKLVECDFFS